jgi:hypothetical protein
MGSGNMHFVPAICMTWQADKNVCPTAPLYRRTRQTTSDRNRQIG